MVDHHHCDRENNIIKTVAIEQPATHGSNF
jgi:hypothetical protein